MPPFVPLDNVQRFHMLMKVNECTLNGNGEIESGLCSDQTEESLSSEYSQICIFDVYRNPGNDFGDSEKSPNYFLKSPLLKNTK